MNEETMKRIIEDYHALRLLIGEEQAYEGVRSNITNDTAHSWQEKEEVLAELLSLHLGYMRKVKKND